jgi:RNA polymerase sigma-54 factor
MKPALRTALGQQLALTPQLRQAIRLLQLSAVELEAELTQALESNPLLDRLEDEDGAHDAGDAHDGHEAHDGPEAHDHHDERDHDHDAEAAPEVELLSPGEAWDEGPGQEDWDLAEGGGGTGAGGGDDEREDAAGDEDLRAHLRWQLQMGRFSPRDRLLAEALIDAIGDDGYLLEPLDAIREALAPDLVVAEDELLAVLHAIQRFDPVGVGARDLAECLGVQLSVLDADTPGLALARRLAASQLEALAKLGPDRLAAQLGVAGAAMATAVSLLRSLDPRPGERAAPSRVEYIKPDCVAFRQGGVWRVALAGGSQPRLGINRHYEGLAAQARGDDASYLRGQLQEAKWLLRALETRADTLLRVARCVVRQQAAFLEHGAEAMRPLTLREVAEEVGLHESTVSRATSRKYLLTPRGTFEFRHFFSSGVGTDDGGNASATAIQAMLRRMIEAEDPRKPLSDAKLAQDLKAAGIPVARRTVAKYREALNLPASHERQRLS